MVGGQRPWSLVIGVFGNKQHGKDTVSNIILSLAREAGLRAKKFALADPLKRVAMELVGMPGWVAFGDDSDIEGREQARQTWNAYGKNGRQWLQWIGTELGRAQVSPEVWIDRAVDTVMYDDTKTAVFAISDCRFHNERETLRARFEAQKVRFMTLRVRRPDWPVSLDHPSESEVAAMPDDLFDAVVVNTGNLDDLRCDVSKVWNLLNIVA